MKIVQLIPVTRNIIAQASTYSSWGNNHLNQVDYLVHAWGLTQEGAIVPLFLGNKELIPMDTLIGNSDYTLVLKY